ncbi:hypothetical protein PIROE2DRAFT_2345 [Piromyces sp. E2]|nr:hypothetical protein PIROE2DRAFT_2345 [Piromyces sp. E2]|eukprot:OUM69709.1 hypothetical protein PIROE2DRAFT_2345 [Piromyces sp. E2]
MFIDMGINIVYRKLFPMFINMEYGSLKYRRKINGIIGFKTFDISINRKKWVYSGFENVIDDISIIFKCIWRGTNKANII